MESTYGKTEISTDAWGCHRPLCRLCFWDDAEMGNCEDCLAGWYSDWGAGSSHSTDHDGSDSNRLQGAEKLRRECPGSGATRGFCNGCWNRWYAAWEPVGRE